MVLHKTRLALAVSWAAAMFSNAAIVYVAPNGEGSGSSWDSPAGSIAVAYAAAAADATEALPGEVHIKGGLYTLTSAITMLPNVKVIGGYEGETILSGDVGTADYWRLKNAGNYGLVIQDGSVYLPEYPADAVSYYSAYYSTADEDTEHAFECVDNDAPCNTFENLTFTLFLRAAIFAEGGDAEKLLVRNCKFYANNHLACRSSTANGGAIDIRKGSATVRDCTFRYNDYGVVFRSTDRITTNLVDNCEFLNNHAKQQYTAPQMSGTGGVVTRGNAVANILNSTFYRCGFTEGNNNDARYSAGAVAIGGVGESGCVNIISNCVFEGNFTVNSYGAAAALLCTHDGANHVAVVGCRFVGNRYQAGDVGTGSAAIQVGADGPGVAGGALFVRDSYFANNMITNWAPSAGPYMGGSVISQRRSGAGIVNVLNCTVEGNVVYATGATGTYGPSTFATSESCKFALVSCTVRDNDVFGANGRLPEFGRNNVYSSSDLAIVNCVITHYSDDYMPFVAGFLGQRGTILATSVIKNFDWGEDLNTYTHVNVVDFGFLVTPVKPTSEVNPQVSDTLRRNGNVMARGILSTSPVRKWGTPVYLGTDHRLYIYVTASPASVSNPWVSLTQHQVHLTPAAAADYGISSESVLVPDAFGEARVAGTFALGALNCRLPGMVISVR